MGGYSDDARMVRVDFFKPNGKWYTTEAVKWKGEYQSCSIENDFLESLLQHLIQINGKSRLSGMTAVCLKPCSEHAYPLMTTVPESVTK